MTRTTRFLTTFAALVILTSAASAETRNSYVFGGGVVAADPYLRLGGLLEGGTRLHETVFVRAHASAGDASDLQGTTGTYHQFRGGVESRHCIGESQRVCGTVGLDLGVSTESIEGRAHMKPARTRGGLVVPRATAEFGRPFRFVVALELPFYNDLAVNDGFETGLAISFGLAYAF